MAPLHKNILITHIMQVVRGALRVSAKGSYSPATGIAKTRKGVLQPCKGYCENPQGGITAL